MPAGQPPNRPDRRPDDLSIRRAPGRRVPVRLEGNETKEATMKYLLLVCWDAERMNAQEEPTAAPAAADAAPAEEEPFPWVDDLRARGIWQIGDQLAPPRRARTVRVRDGRRLVTDGPFAETKEAIGGFDLLECGSLEEAVEIAASHPLASVGTIEVRPLWGQ
jgi:hypothetical protein